MSYVGLDVHKRQVAMCVLDAAGKAVKQKVIRGDEGDLIRELRRLEQPLSLAFEASSGAGYLRDQLRAVAKKVVVANPWKLHVIFKSKRKHDRADAEWLAKLLLLDRVPEAYIPEEDTRLWRETIEDRRRILGRRTAAKCAIRSFLRARGLKAPRGLWTQAGLKWLSGLSFAHLLATQRRDVLVVRLFAADDALRAITQALDAYAKGHGGVALLTTIPGVGTRTAEAALGYIDEPERFRRNNAIGTYFGLIPQQDQSASMNRLGHITRQGPSVVRWLLTEAAWQGIRKSARLRARYQKVLRNDPNRRKIAAVATAHYLARVMLTMLKTGEAWREAV